jgi:hypothetical protein
MLVGAECRETSTRYRELYNKNPGGLAPCCWAGVASRSQHAGYDCPFHGAYRGVHGHAVRADRVEGILEPLVRGSIGTPVN